MKNNENEKHLSVFWNCGSCWSIWIYFDICLIYCLKYFWMIIYYNGCSNGIDGTVTRVTTTGCRVSTGVNSTTKNVARNMYTLALCLLTTAHINVLKRSRNLYNWRSTFWVWKYKNIPTTFRKYINNVYIIFNIYQQYIKIYPTFSKCPTISKISNLFIVFRCFSSRAFKVFNIQDELPFFFNCKSSPEAGCRFLNRRCSPEARPAGWRL